ncbi:hypothetical protein [Arthrobacter sp. zg-Y895]|uniref:hypothetical protein n=1 Tax=Arthrobacter sp. zg-Y895 TaxID=2886933 RepID=UPI001D14F3AA|nr:hypothetical protein [Arthrobacter sp. zg-Y895]MCC3302958.1 hypothetical protein [Arthrobacter sp. zg-Y895]
MSRNTQQGAAVGTDTVTETRPGPFRRLRAQPGFRTAAVVFVLTVVLGLGGPAAYAYWSQSTAVTITGLPTAKVQTPAPPVCTTRALANEISWPAVTDVDPDVVYVLSFAVNGRTKTYAVPRSTTTVKPVYLSGLSDALGRTPYDKVPLAVTLRTATVKKDVPSVTPISEGDILAPSQASTLQMFYYAPPGLLGYPCSR